MPYKRLVRVLAYACASLLVLALLGLTGLYVSLKQGIVPVARVEDFPPPPPWATDRAGNAFSYQPVALHEISQPMLLATFAVYRLSFFHDPAAYYKARLRVLHHHMVKAGMIIYDGTHVTAVLANRLVPQGRRFFLFAQLQHLLAGYELSQTLTPEECLALFLNQGYFGNNQYGVEAAARFYFGVPAQELTLAQSVILLAALHGPNKYNPLTRPTDARRVQEYLLEDMLHRRYITPQQHAEALAESVQLLGPALPPSPPINLDLPASFSKKAR